MKRLLLYSFAIILAQSAVAQVITVEPESPSAGDSISVYFNAAEGDRGLQGHSGDIWAHTGVLTDQSQFMTDWRYVVAPWGTNLDKAKLSFTGDDTWELKIGPSIREYYGVPDGEQITHLTFVFRNSDGSTTGRGDNGGDIFFELPSFGIELIRPEERWFMAEEGERITVEAQASNNDSIRLYHDGELVTEIAGEYLLFEFGAQPDGKHDVVVVASKSGNLASESFSYAVRETHPLPEGVRDGINYIDDITVILVLYAPEKDSVNLTGDFNDWEPGPENLMKNTPDGNRFWLQLDDLEPGKEYRFQYLVDGNLQIADPYTEKTSDYNDQFINEETYPDLIRFPFNETNHAASILQTAQEPYQWKVEDFERPDQTNLVIYELLVRDFTGAHDYNTMIDTLDYLENLGITAVELMPPSEFEGNVSWGYNPSFYFAPDKYYGPKETFKAFIDACHERGIAVIMDLVLNHAYGRCPLVRLYWDEDNNMPADNNPWFNTASPNPVFSWGYDFDHDSEQTKAFVDSVNRFWLQEYKIDGFRFDFTKGFTNTPGDGGAYDASRISILKRMADSMWAMEEDAYVILEHFAAREEEIELTDHGMMIWGNVNHSYRRAGSGFTFDTDLSWGSYVERGFSEPHLVSYMESHDEERLMFEFLNSGRTDNIDYNIRELPIALKRAELCANFFIPLPGPKMIWMFGEIGYDYSIDYNGRVGRKPIKWDYLEDQNRHRLYKVYSALNKLKTEHEVFKTDRFGLSLKNEIRKIRLAGDDMHVVILGNFSVWQEEASAQFTHPGWWYEYWTGDSINVENINMLMSFEPGEYRFYTDVKLDHPDISTGVDEIILSGNPGLNMKIYPNPVSDRLNVILSGQEMQNDVELKVLDLSGKTLIRQEIPYWNSGMTKSIDVANLKRGIYIMSVVSTEGSGVTKFIK